MMVKGKILIVDDEVGLRTIIRRFLDAQGFGVAEAGDCQSAEKSFIAERPDVAIVDYSLPDGDALSLLPRLKAIDGAVPVIVLTGYGSIDLAVRAIKEGADHFLTKPVELPALVVILERLIEARRERRKHIAGQVARDRHPIDPFLGESPAIRQLAARAQRILASESPILIQGETGTGKGVLARWLHEHGPRADEAFVNVDCAGLSREFLETELFGHEKGAYTGAAGPKQGLFEVADRGTVFLDEIGDIDLQVQPKLLKVVEEKRFHRLGSVTDRQVDVRLIAATHHDLAQAVEAKRFRSDLYFRIGAIVLDVPPLRERREDVGVLARHFLGLVSTSLGRGGVGLSPEAEDALRQYPWPGNIREMRNILERAVLLTDRAELGPEDLSLNPRRPEVAGSIDTGRTLEEVERLQIEAVLREEGGRIERAARRLGIHRSSLYSKVKRFGIAVSRN